MELLGYSKVVKQHTELEHTPVGNLYQQATSWESGFIVGELVGLPKGCADSWGVARNFLGDIHGSLI